VSSASNALISTMQYHNELGAGAMSLLDVVTAAHRLGAGGVEFRADYWRDKERDIAAVRHAAAEQGLLAIYATMATLFTQDAAGDEQLRQDTDDAVALGSPLLRVFLGTAPDDTEDPTWERARAAVTYAADRGIILALENFARASGCRVAEIARVLDAIDAPTLQTNVDIGNYALNEEDVVAAVQAFGPRVIMSHLKDAAGAGATYLGGGTLPLPNILAAFEALPQPIIHCFEFPGNGDPNEHIAKSLAYLRVGQGQ
jgi:sugar phosphate isomerase/epimerase